MYYTLGGISDNQELIDFWRFFFFFRLPIANYTVQMKMCKTESVLYPHVKLKSITENMKFNKIGINNSHIKTKQKNHWVHVTCVVRITKNIKF